MIGLLKKLILAKRFCTVSCEVALPTFFLAPPPDSAFNLVHLYEMSPDHLIEILLISPPGYGESRISIRIQHPKGRPQL